MTGLGINPEFRRNLWIELSVHRLIAAPAVFALLFLLFWYLRDERAYAFAGDIRRVYYAIVLLWGTRRAAGAVMDEVDGRTWDAQRLTVLGAWPMAWGKLLGGTAFVWYCALIALAASSFAYAHFLSQAELAKLVLSALGIGLLAQGTALMFCLLLLRKQRGPRRGVQTLSQGLGLAVALLAIGLSDVRGDDWANFTRAVQWYGRAAGPEFFLASLWAFVAWALLAITRLMRLELQYPARPWAWLAFLAFVAAYVLGFGFGDGVAPARLGRALVPVGLALLLLVYASLLSEPKRWLQQRAFFGALARLEGAGLWAAMPLWALAYLALVAVAGAILGVGAPGRELAELMRDWRAPPLLDPAPATAVFLGALLLFVLRDILIVLLLNLGGSRRADMAAVVYFVCLYALAAALIEQVGLTALRPLFLPVYGEAPLLALGPVAVEAAAAGFLMRLRWRQEVSRLKLPAAEA